MHARRLLQYSIRLRRVSELNEWHVMRVLGRLDVVGPVPPRRTHRRRCGSNLLHPVQTTLARLCGVKRAGGKAL